jgi:DNA-binding HxlR family transcriptional regulator
MVYIKQVRTTLCYTINMETITPMNTHVEACPIEAITNLIGGKWKVVIVHHLLLNKTLRFGVLRKKIPGITQKMLTNQLRELEQQKLIARKVYPVVPPKVEYSLTYFGQSLGPVILAMKVWGDTYIERGSS